jgi:hypothetical protein
MSAFGHKQIFRSAGAMPAHFANTRQGPEVGQTTFGKKSKPPQGKIKGLFKIAGSPKATASAHC